MDKSIENYGKAIEINDKDWDAHRGLGVAYILKGTNEDETIDEVLKAKAVRQWQLSLDINPDQPNHKRLSELIQRYSKQKE
jgi:tetratricopeptide (TPR) repeat protein